MFIFLLKNNCCMHKQKVWQRNTIKNIAIVVVSVLLYPVIQIAVQDIQVDQSGNFFLILSILIVTVCFANFAFTYEKSRPHNARGLLLSHIVTFVFMLLLALLLEAMIVAIAVLYPNLHTIMLFFSILLYVGIVLYDYWDLYRVEYM